MQARALLTLLGFVGLLAVAACGDNERPCTPTAVGLPVTTCDAASCTDMFVVAHEDDDLLFMNPEIEGDIVAGHRVAVVYVTAGELSDPTRDQYWIDRERGILNAYAFMATSSAFAIYVDPPAVRGGWTSSTIDAGGLAATEYDLDTQIALVFLRLGDFQGQCLWEDTNGCSGYNPNPPAPPYLAFTKACAGSGSSPACATAVAIPSQNVTHDGLIASLGALAVQFDVTSLGALDATNVNFDELGQATETGAEAGYREYWDHYYSALFALSGAIAVRGQLAGPLQVALYRGYTSSREAPNVPDALACGKQSVFAHYAIYDTDIVDHATPANFFECPDCYLSGDYKLAWPTSWQQRSYATRTVPAGAGRLAIAGNCLDASAAPVACATAPTWTITARNELAIGDQCLAVDITGGHIDTPSPICGDAPCEPVPARFPPESTHLGPCDGTAATTLLVFDNGQIRTANGRCLTLSNGSVTADDCDHVVGPDGHVIGAPPATQTWTLR